MAIMDSGINSDMSSLTNFLQKMTTAHQGREQLIEHMTFLCLSPSSEFIYVHDPWAIESTLSILHEVLPQIEHIPGADIHIKHVFIDCVLCFTPRILFDTIINSLSGVKCSWANGCQVWNGGLSGWNESFDGFLHALRAVHSDLSKPSENPLSSRTSDVMSLKLVLIFERAERLKTNCPDLVIPLSRLGELTRRDIAVIFCSSLPWEEVSSAPGFLADPFRISIERLSKQDTLSFMTSIFPSKPPDDPVDPYNPNLLPLFNHYVEMVYDVCSPFTPDPQELAYIAAARWPAFVRPVLNDWDEDDENSHLLPTEDSRIRLTRFYTASLSHAVETLYPRLLNAHEWSELNKSPEGLKLSQMFGRAAPQTVGLPSGRKETAPDLPRTAVFILIAAFLASFNPPRTDVRMFAKSDGTGRRKRKGGGTRKTKTGAGVKIPQRLLGPMAFPLDRLIAILGSLLDEHDYEARPIRRHLDGDSTEMEVTRVQVLTSITELVAMRLLQRTTPPERIDGPPMFRSAISYDVALELARRVDVQLSDLMWEPY